MELNKNNFLRWSGSFNSAPFSNVAVNDLTSMVVNQTRAEIAILPNDTSTFGIDKTSIVVTLQENLIDPAFWDYKTERLIYTLASGSAIGNKIIKYKWKDVEGNESNEATVTINVVARVTFWRPNPASRTCQLENNVRNGYAFYTLLEKYYADNSQTVIPLQTKPNTQGDPDYSPRFIDTVNCPTVGSKLWEMAPSANFSGSCNELSFKNNYYTANDVTFLTTGVRLFTSNTLTTPVIDQYYGYQGSSYRTVNGYIVDILGCPFNPPG